MKRNPRQGHQQVVTLGALEKAIILLRRIGVAGPQSLSALARNLGIPKSTTHRLLRVLLDYGMVVSTAEGFLLGPPLPDRHRTLRAGSALSMARLVVPHITALHLRAGGATAGLATLSDGRALFLRTIYGMAGLPDLLRSAQRAPAHCTAAGKVLLAYVSDDQRHLFGDRLRRYTPRTIVDSRALERSMRDVRRRGIAFSIEEYLTGVHAVAAPVVDFAGNATLALSIGGQVGVLDLDAAAVLVKRAALAASLTIRIYKDRQLADV